MDVLQQKRQFLLKAEAGLVLFGFFASLLVGVRTHYVDLVKNHLYRYPNEWFPSVSSVIGDHYPARNIVQFCMAITSTPRFLNIYIRYNENPGNIKLFISDVLRTLSIGGWVYVTSCDSGTLHSIFMGLYVLSQSCYMQWNKKSRGMRNIQMIYLANVMVMMTQLYSHRVLKTPGAYSYYAIMEWMLVPLDVAYDQWNTIGLSSFRHERILEAIVELWSGNLFWVNVTSLPAMLWYFPLWNMGLSGYEVVLVSYFAPVLIPLWWKSGMSAKSKSICHFIAGLSFVTFAITSPKLRLLFVALATSASSIEMFRENTVEKLTRGLMSFVAVKFINYSLHPLWPTIRKEYTTNLAIIAFHVAAVTMIYKGRNTVILEAHREKMWMLKSMGAGASLWMLHTFFTDLQTTSLLYTLSPTIYKELWMLFLMAFPNMDFCAAFFRSVLFFRELKWTQFATAAFTHSTGMLLDTCRIITDFQSTLVMCTTYVLLLLADIWAVAYAFVPLGNLLRERSGYVTFAAFIPGLILIYKSNPTWVASRSSTPIFGKALTCGLLFASTLSGFMQLNVVENRNKLIQIRDKNVLTVGIWTVHFGLDNEQYFSHTNMTNLIQKLDLDVVGLLESDTMRPIGSNRNVLKYMAHRMNMHYVYGPKANDHTWGCSMLSKYPVVNSTFHLLPSPVGELACAISATVRVPSGRLVDVIISHNGQEEDVLDRELQTRKLAEISVELENPVIFAGYLVTKPGADNLIYKIITEDGKLKDIFPNDKRRWCEYIMYRDLLPLAYARVSHGNVTDTELQTAKFWVGGNVTLIELNDRNMYPKDLVREAGDSWNGHRYHMYKRPIYGDSLFQK